MFVLCCVGGFVRREVGGWRLEVRRVGFGFRGRMDWGREDVRAMRSAEGGSEIRINGKRKRGRRRVYNAGAHDIREE